MTNKLHKTPSYGALLAIAAILAACDADSATDERRDATLAQTPIEAHEDLERVEADLDTSAVPEELAAPQGETVCDQSVDPPSLTLRELPVADEWLGVGDVLGLRYDNERDVAGEVVLGVAVFSEYGYERVADVAVAAAEAGPHAEVKIELPLADLPLPTAELGVSGRIAITARIDYDDGARENAPRTTMLFFHPDGNGWRVYDEAHRDADYSGGALDPDERRRRQRFVERQLAAGGREENLRFGPSFAVHSEDPLDPALDPLMVADGVPESLLAPAGSTDLAAAIDPSAANVQHTVCFKVPTSFSDAGTGEDYWTTPGLFYRNAVGARVNMWIDEVPSGGDWLGDGLGSGDPGMGCFVFSGPVNAVYNFTLESRGKVNGNTVRARFASGAGPDGYEVVTAWDVFTSGGSHEVWAGSTGDRFNAFQAAAFSIWRHAAGITNATVDVWTGASSSQASGFDVSVMASHVERKFLIAHEVGHVIGVQSTGGRLSSGGSCSQFSGTGPCGAPDHAMSSKEHSQCAIGEGWAHFVAARVWNSQSELNCNFRYWSGVEEVPCDHGNSSWPLGYMRSECIGDHSGKGNELDWMRQFWDVHTRGANAPSLNDMVDWVNTAAAWGTSDGFNKLNQAANTVGGRLDTNWDNYKIRTKNAINYPG